MVVQVLICDALGIPFVVTAVSILLLIAIYSASGGIATIVFTDTLQTALMLLAAVMAFTLSARPSFLRIELPRIPFWTPGLALCGAYRP